MKKDIRIENAPVRKLYFDLREQASRRAGVSVYRPARPDALFFSYCFPKEGAISAPVPGHEERPFICRPGMKGSTPILLWDVKAETVAKQPGWEAYALSLPVCDSRRMKMIPAGDTGLVLSTCERLMRDAADSETPDELLRLVLYRLAFDEAELLAEELPGEIALRQREHRPLSAAAALVIRRWLAGAEISAENFTK